MRVAVLGTGIMGGPMARNLAAAGHDVTAWNRTREKAEGLGATVADTPAEAVDGAEVVLTMLADGPTVDAVVPELDPDPLWIQSSTVGVSDTDRFAAPASALPGRPRARLPPGRRRPASCSSWRPGPNGPRRSSMRSRTG